MKTTSPPFHVCKEILSGGGVVSPPLPCFYNAGSGGRMTGYPVASRISGRVPERVRFTLLMVSRVNSMSFSLFWNSDFIYKSTNQ